MLFFCSLVIVEQLSCWRNRLQEVRALSILSTFFFESDFYFISWCPVRQHNLARDFPCKKEEMGNKKSLKKWSMKNFCLENIKTNVSGTFVQIDLCRTLHCYVKETELKLA